MTPLLRKFLGFHWPLVLITLVLSVFGMVAIYASCAWRNDPSYYWRRQSVWLAAGVVVFVVTSLIDYRWVKWGALPIYVFTVLLLAFTLVVAKPINGAKNWISLGSGVTIEPSQFAVLSGVLTLALFLSKFSAMHGGLRVLCCAAICGAPCMLILAAHNLGETLVWIPVLLAMLFIGGLQLRYLIALGLAGIGFIPLMVNFGLKHYQRGRITAFLDPDLDPTGSGWGLKQSLIAIGSGGWQGKGLARTDTQVDLGFIPKDETHTDYIFVTIGERWGFIGGVVLVCVFAALLLMCLHAAWCSSDYLGLLMVTGIVALLFFHIFQNIGMVIQLMPITGLPLPLISYSGTFALTVMFALGLVNSVWVHRKELPQF